MTGGFQLAADFPATQKLLSKTYFSLVKLEPFESRKFKARGLLCGRLGQNQNIARD